MHVKNILIIVGSAIYIAGLCIFKAIYPDKFSNKLFGLFMTTAIVNTFIAYYLANRNNNGACKLGDPGTCNSNEGCNNGVCSKSNGECACVCKDGYTGEHCEIPPATHKWGVKNYLTNDCYVENTDRVCDEYNYVEKQRGPNGEHGYATPISLCSSHNACRCGDKKSVSNRSVCQVTGYLDPTRPSETCDKANDSRGCSTYNCK